MDAAPNKTANISVTLSWEWPYHDSEQKTKMDSILGKMSSVLDNNLWQSESGEIVKLNGGNVGAAVYNRCGATFPAVARNTANTARAMYNGSGPSQSTDSQVCAVLSAAFDISLTIAQTD